MALLLLLLLLGAPLLLSGAIRTALSRLQRKGFEEAYRRGGGREPFLILAFGGRVRIRALGDAQWKELESNDLLHEGAEIEVEEGSVTFRSATGTVFTLGPHSRLRLSRARRTGDRLRIDVDLLQGSLLADVGMFDPSVDARLVSVNGSYQARQGAFVVSTGPDGDQMAVLRGMVERSGDVSGLDEGWTRDMLLLLLAHSAANVQNPLGLPMVGRFSPQEAQAYMFQMLRAMAAGFQEGRIGDVASLMSPGITFNGMPVGSGAIQGIQHVLNQHPDMISRVLSGAGVQLIVPAPSVTPTSVPTAPTESIVSAPAPEVPMEVAPVIEQPVESEPVASEPTAPAPTPVEPAPLEPALLEPAPEPIVLEPPPPTTSVIVQLIPTLIVTDLLLPPPEEPVEAPTPSGPGEPPYPAPPCCADPVPFCRMEWQLISGQWVLVQIQEGPYGKLVYGQ